MRWLLLIGVVALPQEKVTVDKLDWLAGSWEGVLEGGTFEEHWMKPSGGTMIGMGRHVVKEKTVFVEFMKLAQTEKGVELAITVGGQAEVVFPLVKLDGKEATFENPKHDFPTKIIYRLEKDGSLFARIEGPKGENATDFKLKPKR